MTRCDPERLTISIHSRDKTLPASASTPRGKENHLLAALPAAEYERLLPHLEPVPLELGWALYESGTPQNHVYFPTDCIVSLLYVMEDGSSAEIAVVGNEGLVGISLFMGGETTPQPRGSAERGLRLPAQSPLPEG